MRVAWFTLYTMLVTFFYALYAMTRHGSIKTINSYSANIGVHEACVWSSGTQISDLIVTGYDPIKVKSFV